MSEKGTGEGNKVQIYLEKEMFPGEVSSEDCLDRQLEDDSDCSKFLTDEAPRVVTKTP